MQSCTRWLCISLDCCLTLTRHTTEVTMLSLVDSQYKVRVIPTIALNVPVVAFGLYVAHVVMGILG